MGISFMIRDTLKQTKVHTYIPEVDEYTLEQNPLVVASLVVLNTS